MIFEDKDEGRFPVENNVNKKTVEQYLNSSNRKKNVYIEWKFYTKLKCHSKGWFETYTKKRNPSTADLQEKISLR